MSNTSTIEYLNPKKMGAGDIEPTAEIQTITPRQAQALLGEQHELQRNVNKRAVSKFASDMKGGKHWIVNGQSIVVDTMGRVLDGQHRLLACIEAGVPFPTVIVRGVKPEAFDTIDVGVKRTFAQIIRMKGHGNNNQLGATLKRIYAYEFGRTTRTVASYGEMLEFLNEHPEIVASARAAGAIHAPTTRTNMSFMYYYIAQHDEAAANLFLDVLRYGFTGTSLTPSKNPEYAPLEAFRARGFLYNERGVRLNDRDAISQLIVAWNHIFFNISGPAKAWNSSIGLPEFAHIKTGGRTRATGV